MIIKTKLNPPALKPQMLFRKNLIERLCAAGSYPLIFFSGAAGSGKTSLACQWIEHEKLRVAWYSLDQEDNEPEVFFQYLLSALSRTDEQLDKAFGPMLANQRALAEEEVVPHLIDSLSDVSRNIHLVLDDLHQIVNEKIHAALARLIQYLPDRLHLIILSRYYLPASMDIAAIKKKRLEISASDLKFTQQETADLFKEVIPLSFSADQIHYLTQQVEGWAAGLQLIGLSIKSSRGIVDLSHILNQAHDQVANYLIHDILSMQSEETRNFVFATALLDRFSPELCAEITGYTAVVKILSRLTLMNLFLIPLDTDPNWYRYHHMFSEVVRQQVAIEYPDRIPAILRKAAMWFAENNCLEDALRCAFRSHDFEFAADLMEEHITEYNDQNDPRAGIRWLLRLPSSVLNQRALLRLHHCGFLLVLMEHAEFKEIFSKLTKNKVRTLKRYSGFKRAFCKDYLTFLECMMQIFYTPDTEETGKIQNIQNAPVPENPIFAGTIEVLIAFRLIAIGALSSAEKSLIKASEMTAGIEFIRQKINIAKARSLVARHQGRLHQAEAIINQTLDTLMQRGYGKSWMMFLFHRYLGHIYYLQNKLDNARECAAIAAQYSEYAGLLNDILEGNELNMLLHLAKGEKEQAVKCIQKMQAFAVKIPKPQIIASAKANIARMAIEQGNLVAAELWSRRRKLRVDEPFSLLLAMESLTQARLLYAQKLHAQAVSLLETLRGRCLRRNLQGLVLEIDILRSAALHALDQNETAKLLLQEALVFSETEGYVRPFINDASRIEPILKSIAANRSDSSFSSYFKTVLSACGIPVRWSVTRYCYEINPHENLTSREIEVLDWMAKGAKNKNIAQELFISINTVKAHVRSILAKLGVETRTQAILKAKEMKLLIMN